jgi:hypothetical protein
MNYIDLRYIGASDLAKNLSNMTELTSLKDYLLDQLNHDLGLIDCYIEKYDNIYDKNSVDLNRLKEEKQGIINLLNKLK